MAAKSSANSLVLLCRAGLKSRYFVTGLVSAYLSAHAAHAQQKLDGPDVVRYKREQAALAARAGKLGNAISQLEQLSLQAPRDYATKADLIVLLRQAGRNEQIRQMTTSLPVDAMPDYAFMPWIAALRDTQAYGRAELLALQLKQRLRQQPISHSGLSEQNLDIYLAMIRVESGQKQAARRTVNAISRNHLSASQYAQLAYVYRELGDSLTCLSHTDMALSMQPDNPLALQQMIAALSDIGASTRAYDIARKFPEVFPASQLAGLRTSAVLQQMKDAVTEYGRLSALEQQAEAYALLDRTLHDANDVLQHLAVDDAQYMRLTYDYMHLLRLRERMADVVALYQQLPAGQQDTPDYVRRAVADAYLALQQPVQALAMYQQLLNENDQPDAGLYTAAYYAYVESEKDQQAIPLLQQLQRDVPLLQYRELFTTDDVRIDWRALDVMQLASIAETAYQPQLPHVQQQAVRVSRTMAGSRLLQLDNSSMQQPLLLQVGQQWPIKDMAVSHTGVGLLNSAWPYQLQYARRAQDMPLRPLAHGSVLLARYGAGWSAKAEPISLWFSYQIL